MSTPQDYGYKSAQEMHGMIKKLENTLQAIKARVSGEWDNKELVKFGALSTDTNSDINKIIEGIK